MNLLPVLIMFILYAINIPVAFALAISALIYFFTTQDLPMQIFIQKMIGGVESFPLLAVPFFITAGAIMNYGGITSRLMNLANILTAHMNGGLAQVNVLLSTLMGGLSGSANADAAMQSKILVPEMIKRGYSKGFSAVVTACSSVISPTIPPGIGMIVFGCLANVSIGRLFIGGIVPGILLCVGLMFVVNRVSLKKGYGSDRDKRFEITEFIGALKEASWSLVIPITIIGGIRFGIFTPTEAGAITAVYAMIVGTFIYKEIKIKDIFSILVDSIRSTSVVMLIISAASVFSFYMSWERIPIELAEHISFLTQNPILLLLVINVFLIIIGMFIEGSASLILLTPILMPIITRAGIDPVHFGIVFVLNLTIAGVTPPLGTLMYTTCSIIEVSVEDFVKELLPFLIVLFVVLFLITYIPQLVLFLPNLIMH